MMEYIAEKALAIHFLESQGNMGLQDQAGDIL
jgi:hypothetical protein